MNKQEAIEIFGTVRDTAYALGISTQAVHKWPDELSEPVTDRVVGAATRLGIMQKIVEKVNHEHNGKNAKRPRPKPKRAP